MNFKYVTYDLRVLLHSQCQTSLYMSTKSTIERINIIIAKGNSISKTVFCHGFQSILYKYVYILFVLQSLICLQSPEGAFQKESSPSLRRLFHRWFITDLELGGCTSRAGTHVRTQCVTAQNTQNTTLLKVRD